MVRGFTALPCHVFQCQQGLHGRTAKQGRDHQEGRQQRLPKGQAPQPAVSGGRVSMHVF
jgi:hypothetical protein